MTSPALYIFWGTEKTMLAVLIAGSIDPDKTTQGLTILYCVKWLTAITPTPSVNNIPIII